MYLFKKKLKQLSSSSKKRTLMSGVRWEEISEAAKDLVSQLLVVDPRSRMSAEDVLHGVQQ